MGNRNVTRAKSFSKHFEWDYKVIYAPAKREELHSVAVVDFWCTQRANRSWGASWGQNPRGVAKDWKYNH